MRGRDVLDDRLVEAANRGDVDGIRQALEAGADVHARNGLALHCAAWRGGVDAVRILLTAGANPRGTDGRVARLAADHGNLDVLELLVSAGSAMPEFPLKGAAISGNLAMVRLGVENMGICRVRDLHMSAFLAMLHCQRETFLYLVAAGGWKPFVSNPKCSLITPEILNSVTELGPIPGGTLWDGIFYIFTDESLSDVAESSIFEIADLACFFASVTNADVKAGFAGYIPSQYASEWVDHIAKLGRWISSRDAQEQNRRRNTQTACFRSFPNKARASHFLNIFVRTKDLVEGFSQEVEEQRSNSSKDNEIDFILNWLHEKLEKSEEAGILFSLGGSELPLRKYLIERSINYQMADLVSKGLVIDFSCDECSCNYSGYQLKVVKWPYSFSDGVHAICPAGHQIFSFETVRF